jgi:hypothetical protein
MLLGLRSKYSAVHTKFYFFPGRDFRDIFTYIPLYKTVHWKKKLPEKVL